MNVAAMLTELVSSNNRMEIAPRIAREMGGENLMLFSQDPVSQMPLPAIGFPQTLPSGRQWLDCLKALKPLEVTTCTLPSPYGGNLASVTAVCDGAGTVLAVLGGEPCPDVMRQVAELLPLAGLALQREQQVRAANARVQEMSSEISTARQLTRALDTVRRELEIALERASRETAVAEQATRELRRVNQELAVARDQALAANRAKSAFLANMSHELRTPLTAVIGYSEMLQEEISKPEARLDLKRIQDAGQHLLTLVNDILDMAKIEAGKQVITVETFSVHEVMEEAAEVALPQATNHGNTIIVEPAVGLPQMHSDRIKLRQVLVNLCSNAAKFTRDGTITLRASYSEEERQMSILVRDTGIGIPESELQSIFTEFAQVVNQAKPKTPGTGLGLTISRRMTTLLGGHIKVDSRPGEGSVFTVTVPLQVPVEHLQAGAQVALTQTSAGE
jgi:signal transduction histidine kinase